MKVVLYLALVTAVHALPSEQIQSLTDEFIDLINNKQSTWTAGRNFHVNISVDKIRRLGGIIKAPRTFPVRGRELGEQDSIPESFDAREHWPDCPSVREVRDQGRCSSSWVLAAVETMSDRICIHSKGEKKVSVSAEDLLSCCMFCGSGCNGGYLENAWRYWGSSGIVTGGMYGDTKACKAYSIEPCSHYVRGSPRPACGNDLEPTPSCSQECDSSSLNYTNELTFGLMDSFHILPNDATQIQVEIMINGPVEASYKLYEDFVFYKKGVYQYVTGAAITTQVVKILGWGVENDTPYWLAANSWNTDWGDKGFFKILRGSNHLGIEEEVVSGLPQL